MKRKICLVLIFCAIILLLVYANNAKHTSEKNKFEIISNLPMNISYFSCANDLKNNIYCFGGHDQGSHPISIIIKYSISNNTAEIIKTKLPSPRAYLSCANYGKNIYCFGGRNDTFINEILEFNTKNEKLVVKESRLPFGRAHFSCITDTYNPSEAQNIYCLGGSTNNVAIGADGYFNDIIVYNPLLDKLDTIKIEDKIYPRYQVTCARGIKEIYCFGGASKHYKGTTNTIISFNPKNNQIELKNSTFTNKLRLLGCSGGYGENIYCFGGDHADTQYYNSIYSYNTKKDELKIIVEMQLNYSAMSCVKSSDSIYCF